MIFFAILGIIFFVSCLTAIFLDYEKRQEDSGLRRSFYDSEKSKLNDW